MVLVDTTVLSNFAQIQRPEWVQLVLPDAVTTEWVIQELESGVSQGYVPLCDWSWVGIVQLSQDEQMSLDRACLVLDKGEASCIAVAVGRDAMLYTDDLLARSSARQEGIDVSGTLGVLAKLVFKGYLSVKEADRHLRTMIAHGYRSPVDSLSDLGITEP